MNLRYQKQKCRGARSGPERDGRRASAASEGANVTVLDSATEKKLARNRPSRICATHGVRVICGPAAEHKSAMLTTSWF